MIDQFFLQIIEMFDGGIQVIKCVDKGLVSRLSEQLVISNY